MLDVKQIKKELIDTQKELDKILTKIIHVEHYINRIHVTLNNAYQSLEENEGYLTGKVKITGEEIKK